MTTRGKKTTEMGPELQPSFNTIIAAIKHSALESLEKLEWLSSRDPLSSWSGVGR
eukprot:CAMPEP_0201617084 /NCGR_PEP_ID=MMETSP0492-20130828/35430_1 /ASSEMBLY_ACC=CAM_ASM_000837 /TAXON_ID=420259 /ORGANISM="Thalassiosira gravida, Strain GMp14c1" /LENGTH=54 /DNA_ID=CAMNT_0048085217 /DNA_START=30 /DNA_END=192 /DNA_ORIENTATION=+